jgi:hypothetical protein
MGDAVDMGAVYSGRFQSAWSVARRRSCAAPQRVDILINTSLSNIHPADWILWRGVAAVALNDKLESAGYMTRIVVGNGGETSAVGGESERRPNSIRITIKDYDAPLNVSAMAAALLPGFMRSLIIRWVARHADHPITRGVKKVGDPIQEPGEFMVSHETHDRASAIAWVNRAIAQIESGLAQEAA